MRCASRPSQAGETGAGRRMVRAVARRLRAGAVRPRCIVRPRPSAAARALADTHAGSPIISSDVSAGQSRQRPRQQFPRAARQPGDQWRRSHRADQSRRRRCLGSDRSAEVPRLGRGLRHFVEDRCAGRFRRRPPHDLGRRGRHRRHRRARRQSRPLRRPEPQQDRRAAGVPVGDPGSHPGWRQLLRRQGAMDLGRRACAWLWQVSIRTATPGRLCDFQLRRQVDGVLDRARLLLDERRVPDRSETRVRICAFADGRDSPNRAPTSSW